MTRNQHLLFKLIVAAIEKTGVTRKEVYEVVGKVISYISKPEDAFHRKDI